MLKVYILIRPTKNRSMKNRSMKNVQSNFINTFSINLYVFYNSLLYNTIINIVCIYELYVYIVLYINFMNNIFILSYLIGGCKQVVYVYW